MLRSLTAIIGALALAHDASPQSLVSVDEIVASGFQLPVQVTAPPDGSDRLFVVEQRGRIRVVEGGVTRAEPFLDLGTLVSTVGEQGLLGLAFHPRYAENGLFYVDYTDRSGDTVVARYAVSSDPNVADPQSAAVLLSIDQPFSNHNGGQLQFGPFDGYLYIGMGDGGSANDPLGNGQNAGTLLGALLRIDIDGGSPYAVPPDNPFVGVAGADEIWAYGLRNPWRFAFDRETGDLYIGDVGQGTWEEIDVLPGGAPGGTNFGWAIREGPCPLGQTLPCAPAPEGLTDPIAFYGRDQGRSVTGGFVYRGLDHPSLAGRYFFADYVTGRLWSLEKTSSGGFSSPRLELETGFNVSSFGEDEQGELYVVDYGGTVRRLTALDSPVVTDPAPGATLAPFEQTFEWDARETPASDWRLTAGSAPGAADYFDSGALGGSTSVLATGLPTDGSVVHVRLFFFARGQWRFADFEYLASALEAPAIRWPRPGAALRTRWAPFVWTRGPAGVTGFRLTVGSAPGAADYYDSGALPWWRCFAFATRLPVDGSTLHVRLAYEVSGRTLFFDASYTAATRSWARASARR